MEKGEKEVLFVGTAESEHIEMYLKAIWWLKDMNEQAKVSSIARVLNVTQPSVVQMLKKLNDMGLVIYKKGTAELTEKGEAIGRQMVRNSRLLEVMMKNALKIDIDEEMVCGIEHHMNKRFTDALCSLLNHPERCPHGHRIPRGECCNRDNKD
ncbi:MAG: metal-dependent transcriptional regulator [Candidatus Nitrosothermus koennekii]|nr:MAG: metal-dependent transcriptional regulator [Candidatus Nitrosothermus koennekii]